MSDVKVSKSEHVLGLGSQMSILKCLDEILRTRSSRRGSVSVLGAFSMVPLIGLGALSIELGQGYEAKIRYQGAADAAALAAANAYAGSQTDQVLLAAAQDIARANGVSPSSVTVSHLTNYNSSVSDAVQVTILTTVPIYLARIFSSKISYNVGVSAIASLATSQPTPCIMALSSDNGISLSGGTSLNAPDCAVVSNSSLSVTGGSTVSAKAVTSSAGIDISGGSTVAANPNITFGTALTNAAGSNVRGKQIKKSNSAADPLAGNAALSSAFGKLGSYVAPRAPSVPEGSDMSLSWYPTTMTFQGYTGTLVDGTWTFPAGTYNFRNLNTGSLKLKILGPSTVTVSGSVSVGGGGGLMLPDGFVAVNAPITLSGGTAMTVGAGRHYFGQISLGGGSTATIGAGDLDVYGAILVDGGGSKMTIGSGNYVIGNDGSRNAIKLSGGSYLSFGNGTFSANGAVTTAGGSTIIFGTTDNHLINGNLDLNGNSTFGDGIYTINGYFTNNTGGAMTGRNVSFILAGTLSASGGTSIDLAAPTSGTGIADILFATRSSAATTLGGGTQDIYSGIIYVPNSDFRMSGGASASGSCFSLIAKTVTLSSGPSAATACPSMGGGSGSMTVNLIR